MAIVMGLASSNAVRRDDAYGSLGGSFGGVERKLKKKPVLVLDPEELAKAHQLFQIGAAEQLGEFDPKDRVFRPAAALFSPNLSLAPRYDQDDDYVAPVSLVESLESDIGEVDEHAVDDLPPIDLNALLVLMQAEQDEEDAFYRQAAAAAEELEPEFTPEAEPDVIGGIAPREPVGKIVPETVIRETDAVRAEPAARTPSPADALARIVERAAAQPKAAPEITPLIAPQTIRFDAASPPAPTPEPQPATKAQPQPAPVAHEPDWISAKLAQVPEVSDHLLDLSPQQQLEEDALALPETPSRVLPTIGAAGTRSNLRARLVREDLTLARQKPTLMQQITLAWRRFRASMPL